MTVARKVAKRFQGLKGLPGALASLGFLPLSFSLICGSFHDTQGTYQETKPCAAGSEQASLTGAEREPVLMAGLESADHMNR